MKAIVYSLALLPITFATLSGAADSGSPRDEAERVEPVQIALWNPVQTSDETSGVRGFRLNLPYGVNRDLRGFDLGIASSTNGDFSGFQLGVGAYVLGDVRGARLNLLVSITEGSVLGMQSGAYNDAGYLRGFQTGLVNLVGESVEGARFGAVNVSGASLEGAELGVVNHGRRVRGLQLGVVNVASELHGVQIGVVNVAKNGFLPFFPVVNSAL